MGNRNSSEIGSVPADFDDLVEWVDHVSSRLVLLEDYALPEVERWVEAVERGVRAHVAENGNSSRRSASRAGPGGPPAAAERLGDDHARFLVSLEQLRWFLRIVQHDDHGGNRQALGQYGRVLAEALARHRRDERLYLTVPSAAPTAARS